jgi:hypothetical protein
MLSKRDMSFVKCVLPSALRMYNGLRAAEGINRTKCSTGSLDTLEAEKQMFTSTITDAVVIRTQRPFR